MRDNQQINLNILEEVASALGEINKEVIYVGGAVISLYTSNYYSEEVRPTKDIDISVQISTYAEMDKLRERLAEKEIFPASGESVMYRFTYKGILIDFIPFEKTELGPTNPWLKPGFEVAIPVQLKEIEVKILPVSLFLATKWAAFKSRGSDPRTSHDFEDIIFVLDNNTEVLSDVARSKDNVKEFLKNMSNEILTHSSTNEIIECHLNPLLAVEKREVIKGVLNEILFC